MGVEKAAAGIAAVLIAAQGAYAVVKGPSSLLRPPGAQGEADFMARCIKCGKCQQACPYQAIQIAGAGEGAAAGTPFIDARRQACRMCEDFPCVDVCPTQALRDVATRADVNMGYAVINENTCIAFKGMRCEVCYRVCPLIDRAITVQFGSLEGDSIHAQFAPTIDRETCTGCGLCVERCVISDPAVPIRIVSVAEQEAKGSK